MRSALTSPEYRLPVPPHQLQIAGPNQGRAFYKCSKVSKTSQCDYFSWADGPDDGARNGAGGGDYRDRANAGGGGPAPSGDCFNCGECTCSTPSFCASRSRGTDADDALVQLVIGRRIARKPVPEARTPEAAAPSLQAQEVAVLAAAVAVVAPAEGATSAEKVSRLVFTELRALLTGKYAK